MQQQNFSEAERHFEAALEAAERFPSDDERLGKSYNNLAAVYYAQEDYARAEPLMRRALAQLREALGPENTEVAQTMKNLAALYYLQGNRSEAEALLKQSLTVLEKLHGPNHAFVATVLSNLAGLYQAEDRYQDAEPLLTRSLAIWESLLGPDHPDVVRSRTLLAQVQEARGGGRQPAGTAAAQSSTPAAPEPVEQADAATTDDAGNAEEIAQATAALQRLATESQVVAAEAGAPGVPVPVLSSIDQQAREGLDAAATPGAEDGPRALTSVVQNSEPSGSPANLQATSDVVTPAIGPVRGAEQAAVAILNEATSADEVSFSIYLSTLWSVDEARRYWHAVRAALPEVFEDKRMELQEVSAAEGADPFYRVLTAPYASEIEAQAVCEEIKSRLRTHDCGVVVRGEQSEG